MTSWPRVRTRLDHRPALARTTTLAPARLAAETVRVITCSCAGLLDRSPESGPHLARSLSEQVSTTQIEPRSNFNQVGFARPGSAARVRM